MKERKRAPFYETLSGNRRSGVPDTMTLINSLLSNSCYKVAQNKPVLSALYTDRPACR